MAPKIIDITNQKFGKLTALEKIRKKYHTFWICKCDCGNTSIVCGTKLRKGLTRTCGCNAGNGDFIQKKKNKEFQTYEEAFKYRLLKNTKWNGNCLEWTSKQIIKSRGLEKGYGAIRYKGKMMLTHRASWLIHKGEIPEGLMVLHHCDNPLCINPSHLFLGTAKDNSDDKIKKGRAPNQGKGKRKKKLTI